MIYEAEVKKVASKSNKFGEPEHTLTFVATNQDVDALMRLLGTTVQLTIEEGMGK